MWKDVEVEGEVVKCYRSRVENLNLYRVEVSESGRITSFYSVFPLRTGITCKTKLKSNGRFLFLVSPLQREKKDKSISEYEKKINKKTSNSYSLVPIIFRSLFILFLLVSIVLGIWFIYKKIFKRK
ncbi:hypothetical protein [endosymbiont GvMRE of Glomus versiforme]|uniref:hypothetical protein n=1 Tax=endosymbiont GvMRE of Glomus versiforme TaxID=2039283 RepID=UPI000EBF8078|nr:hypothetical protein [endosymbiont GvMRE of Glomus versiforme]RHZ36995.1 hypothetical protein GvMRE_I2g196 [endosymbiont GvMRE of Glomus versiforme]